MWFVILLVDFLRLFIFFKIMVLSFSATYSFAFDEPEDFYAKFDALENYHAKRQAAFNTTADSQNRIIVGGELRQKKSVVCEYTMEICESLEDDSETLMHYVRYNKAEILFKAIMGSVITDKYMLEEDDAPELKISDPLFSYFTVISLVNDLAYDFVVKIRRNGYEPVDVRDINQCRNKYDVLFKYSGVKRDVFARWFNEVFSAYEPGFRLENPNLEIRSYDPLEPAVTEFVISTKNLNGILKPESNSFRVIPYSEPNLSSGVRLIFDPRCDNPKLCSHSDTPKIIPAEIEACYLGHPDNFRRHKPRLAAKGNTKGNVKNRALGREFGNPDEVGISSREKIAIERSISVYLKERNRDYSAYIDRNLKNYTEVDLGEVEEELSEETIFTFDNTERNFKRSRIS